MIKARMFLFKFIFLICLIFLINGLLSPLWSHNFIKTNSSNFDSLLDSSNSSTWSRIWETEHSIGEELVTDASYNVYIAGRIYEYTDNKIFNIKYDKYGFEQWNKTWKFYDYCENVKLAIDSRSNIFNLVSFSLSDLSVLMKINNSGFSEWNQTIKGCANVIYLDKLDNIYISGYIWDSNTDMAYIFLKKFNQNGISLWNNTFLVDDFHDLSLGYPCAIMVDHLNQTWVAGLLHTLGFPGESTYLSFNYYTPAPYVYISVYNSSGNLVSFHKWRIYDYYISKKIIFDTSCNLYLMGVDKSLSLNKLFKHNSSGELIFSTPDWHKDAIGETLEFWENIAQDPSNNTYCTGINYFWTGRGNYELYIVRFDNQGNFEWDGAYNLFHDARCSDIYIDSNYSIYLTGINDERMLILKNPILGDFSDPFYINLELIISASSIFCIWGLIGIFFYIRFLRRSPKKVLITA